MSNALRSLVFSAVVAVGLAAATGAAAFTPAPLSGASPAVEHVWGGCGPGLHPGPYGGCVPNVYGAVPYVGGGYYGGVYRGGAYYHGGAYYRGGGYHGGVYRGGAYHGGAYRGGVYRGGVRR